MKKLFLFFIMIFFISNNLLTAQNKQNEKKFGTLKVIIRGLKNNKGDVKIGLFNSEESFNGKEKKFKGAIIKAENKRVIWEVRNLPFGDYAIKAFHDEDQDDDLPSLQFSS